MTFEPAANTNTRDTEQEFSNTAVEIKVSTQGTKENYLENHSRLEADKSKIGKAATINAQRMDDPIKEKIPKLDGQHNKSKSQSLNTEINNSKIEKK